MAFESNFILENENGKILDFIPETAIYVVGTRRNYVLDSVVSPDGKGFSRYSPHVHRVTMEGLEKALVRLSLDGVYKDFEQDDRTEAIRIIEGFVKNDHWVGLIKEGCLYYSC